MTSCGDYHSRGVCVDQDGFVYVTDRGSKINIYSIYLLLKDNFCWFVIASFKK